MPRFQAYVVVVGTQPGIYTDWPDAQEKTSGVSGASYKGFTDWNQACRYFREKMRQGKTQTVERAPVRGEPGLPAVPRVDEPRLGAQQPRARALQYEQREEPIWEEVEDRRPGRGSSTRTGSASTISRRAARDADIAAAVEQVRREKESCSQRGVYHPAGASAREVRKSSTRAGATARGQSGGRATTATGPATAPPRMPVHTDWTSASAVRPTHTPAVAIPTVQQTRRPQEVAKSSSGPSTSSSPPTAVTQTKNVFSESASTHTSPRYAQSLSYASSPENASTGLRSPPLAPSDQRSHLSSPSSLGTQYFPEDYLAREAEAARSPRVSDEARASSPSEYATAPNTPEMQDVSLPAVNDYARAHQPMNVARAPIPLPQLPSESAPRNPSASTNLKTPSRGRHKAAVVRSLSDAQVQTESQRRRKLSEAAVQTASAPKKRYVESAAQVSRNTTPRVAPLRATASEGARSFNADGICTCKDPDCVCRACGGKPHAMRSVANHLPSPKALSPVPLPVTEASPPPSVSSASFATPTSSIRASSVFQSMRSPQGGNTPIMGHTETDITIQSRAESIQAALGMLSFSNRAQGEGPVVHDMHFDPRSPIQRGTSIPAGTSGWAARPSPAMQPQPLDSLLFGTMNR